MTAPSLTETAVDDETFMGNVREAHANGFDAICIYCGVGVFDSSDVHERTCPDFVESVH